VRLLWLSTRHEARRHSLEDRVKRKTVTTKGFLYVALLRPIPAVTKRLVHQVQRHPVTVAQLDSHAEIVSVGSAVCPAVVRPPAERVDRRLPVRS
jgi:hypothetical protein